MSAPAAARLHLDHVDGLRAVAALVVYLNHAYAQVTYGATVDLAQPLNLAKASMVAGHLSVTVFIVLSGFCLSLPIVENGGVLRGGVLEFMKRRARRILPPYYAALALCLLLIATIIGKPTGSLWDFPILVTKLAVVSHVLLLQDLIATSRINYVFWSIAVEWQLYFLMPPLVWALRRVGLLKLVVGALLVGYAIRIGFDETRVARMHPHFLGMFCFGMLAAHLVRSHDVTLSKLRDGAPWWLIGWLGAALAAIAGYVWGVRGSEARFYLLDLPVGAFTVAVLVISSRPEQGLLHRALRWKPLVVVGTFSYSLYLIHAPLLQVMWQYALVPFGVSHELMFVLLMTLGLGLVLGCAYLFFLAFEAPFLRSAARNRANAAPAAAG